MAIRNTFHLLVAEQQAKKCTWLESYTPDLGCLHHPRTASDSTETRNSDRSYTPPTPPWIGAWCRCRHLLHRLAILAATQIRCDDPVMRTCGGLLTVPRLSLVGIGSKSATCASVPGAAMSPQAWVKCYLRHRVPLSHLSHPLTPQQTKRAKG